MGIFNIIIFIIVCAIALFLAWRCIVLTKALARFYILINQLVEDSLTKDNIKLIASAMYGLSVEEFERRLSNEH